MKKTIKIIYCILFFVIILFSLQNIVLAAPGDTTESGSTSWNAKEMLESANSWGSEEDGGVQSTAQNIIGTAIKTIRIVGVGIAIIMITYVAIKYMSAAPSERAEFKKSATAYIVGAVILFGSSQILGLIADFATSNISGGK